MSRFAGASTAQAFTNGTYFEGAGEYDVEIVDVIYKVTRNSGPALIVEMKVTKTTDEAKTPVGSKRSWVQTLAKKDIAFPNIIAWLGAMLGYDPNNATHVEALNKSVPQHSEALLETICDAKTLNAKPIKGWPLHVSTAPHKTKAGKDITTVRFSPRTA